jgi:hypothetical protein
MAADKLLECVGQQNHHSEASTSNWIKIVIEIEIVERTDPRIGPERRQTDQSDYRASGAEPVVTCC